MARKRITKYTICAYTPGWLKETNYSDESLLRLRVVEIAPSALHRINNRDLFHYIQGMLFIMENAIGNVHGHACTYCYGDYNEELDNKLPRHYIE